MKKNIFYTMQSAEVFFSTLFDCCKAILAKIYWGNIAIKKFFYCNMFLFISLFFTVNSFGQDVGSSAIKANFGIDGDVYANRTQFKNFDTPLNPVKLDSLGTDDWFLKISSWPGSGLGVIDEVLPKGNPDSDAITLPITQNTSFQRRQSVYEPNVPGVPFPVVVGGDGMPYLWLDAVYGRDTYVKGGGAETSYFAGTGDKNSDNPNTWSVGTSGSVPQKDDIIDVYAHLRGEGPRVPPNALPPADPNYNANDDRPFTKLWAYAGASLVVTNGNKHLDFEFFRTAAELQGATIINTGADGGRTAWTFNLDGSIATPGTIIVSVDYINGGNVPSIRIRVWMSQQTFNDYNNNLGARPFDVDKNVAFEKGLDSGDYGYAAINPIGGGVKMWGRVNDNFSSYEGSRTFGPLWGTYEGTKPDAVDMYTRYQFVEIAIDLTAFGLDRRGAQNKCSNLLGSLMVKTRSSGGGPNEGAFGSELKDFAGPYLFGFTGEEPTLELTPTAVSCNGASDGSISAAFGGGGSLEMNIDGGTFTAVTTSPKVFTGLTAGDHIIIVRRTSNIDCFVSKTVNISEPPALSCNAVPTNPLCSTGTGTITVTPSGGTGTKTYTIAGPTVNTTGASSGIFTGLSAGNYTVTTTDANNCTTTCTAMIVIPPALVASDSHVDVTCLGFTDGSVTVTFSGGTAPYMVNFNGEGFVTQTSPKAYTGLAAGTYSWVVKDDHGCEMSGSETVTQPTALIASDAHTNVTCNGGTDGSVTVTFSGGTAPYMVNFNGGGFVTQTSPYKVLFHH